MLRKELTLEKVGQELADKFHDGLPYSMWLHLHDRERHLSSVMNLCFSTEEARRLHSALGACLDGKYKDFDGAVDFQIVKGEVNKPEGSVVEIDKEVMTPDLTDAQECPQTEKLDLSEIGLGEEEGEQ